MPNYNTQKQAGRITSQCAQSKATQWFLFVLRTRTPICDEKAWNKDDGVCYPFQTLIAAKTYRICHSICCLSEMSMMPPMWFCFSLASSFKWNWRQILRRPCFYLSFFKPVLKMHPRVAAQENSSARFFLVSFVNDDNNNDGKSNQLFERAALTVKLVAILLQQHIKLHNTRKYCARFFCVVS